MILNFDILEKILNLSNSDLQKEIFLREFYDNLLKLIRCKFMQIWIYSIDKIIKIDKNNIKYKKIKNIEPKILSLKDLSKISEKKIPSEILVSNLEKTLEKKLENCLIHFENIYLLKRIPLWEKILIFCKFKNNHFDKNWDIIKFILKLAVFSYSMRQTSHSLKERIKELSCVYKFLQISNYENLSIDDFLKQIIDIIPPAWQYPSVSVAKIKLDNLLYLSKKFKKPIDSQRANITINGKVRGYLEVGYTEKKPREYEGPFLKEERELLENISFYISFVIERKEAEKEKKNLELKMQRADKIATIGMLSSGIAHELNEPLNIILGFSEVLLEGADEDSQIKKDIEKIRKAGLHMREIIRKLIIFSRQEEPSKVETDINFLVKDTLSFLEKKCENEKIKIILNLDKNLKPIKIDQSQIRQVFINLILNAIQAMPKGGNLKISTFKKNKEIVISFEDTGEGIREENLSKLFLPFFTTKEVGKGTGLGLPVSLGIVKAHKGRIEVKSQWKKGSKFDVILPIK